METLTKRDLCEWLIMHDPTFNKSEYNKHIFFINIIDSNAN